MKRLLLVSLCVFLSGCSFDYFGGQKGNNQMLLSDNGLSLLNQNEKVTRDLLQMRFGDEYSIRSGVHMQQGKMNHVFDVMKGKNVIMTFYTQDNGSVDYVVITNEIVNTSLKNNPHIGTLFSNIYEKAFGFCLLDNVTDTKSEINCLAPKSESIYFIFSGEWKGPKNLLPSDDVLKKWRVNRIVWVAKK